MFLEWKKDTHSDINIIIEFNHDLQDSVKYETGGQYNKTAYKLDVINRGETLKTKPLSDGKTFEFRNGSGFEFRISENLFEKMMMWQYKKGDIVLIRFETKKSENNFWKIERAEAKPVDINDDINIDESAEKQKMANAIQRKNSISTTDDRIAWAVAINNATKLVSHINCKIDEKIELIEESTARIYELVKSLDTYLTNQTEETHEEKEPF